MESSSSSGSKRRRLMVSYVSLRPDLSATFESLNDDSKRLILQFVGNKSYRSFGGLNKHCKEVYLATKGMTKETFLYGYGPLPVIKDYVERAGEWDWELHERVGKGVVLYNRNDVMKWVLEEQNTEVLNGICIVAAEEGRTDLLNEVLNNMNDDYDIRSIFERVDSSAACCGKLDVLEFLKDKGLSIDEGWCANRAAKHGQLNILKWLREERGLELHRYLYYHSIDGGQLHVMKWLREQDVPWVDDTFREAAEEGNLNILQWLHDEGCPWSERTRYRVYKDEVEPEVIDWLRSHGYGDRIQI